MTTAISRATLHLQRILFAQRLYGTADAAAAAATTLAEHLAAEATARDALELLRATMNKKA